MRLYPIVIPAQARLHPYRRERASCSVIFNGSVFGELSRTAELAERLAPKSVTGVTDFSDTSCVAGTLT